VVANEAHTSVAVISSKQQKHIEPHIYAIHAGQAEGP